MAKMNVDEVAAVIDQHTGKVRARFQGFGAKEDAASFARHCKQGGVDFLNTTSIITGEAAKKAIKNGRV